MPENFKSSYDQKKNELEIAKAEAEASFDGEKVGEIEKQLQELETEKAEFETIAQQVETIPQHQVDQIKMMGGDPEAVPGLTEVVEEAKTIETDAEQKVAEKIAENKNEVVGENFPISFDYVGKSVDFKPIGGSAAEAKISGRVTLGKGINDQDILQVPLEYNQYYSKNRDKSPIFKMTNDPSYDFEKPFIVKKEVFFNPATKEIYFLDKGKVALENSGNVQELMESIYNDLKS